MPRMSDFDSHTPDYPSHPNTTAPSAQALVCSTAPLKENRRRGVWRRATRRNTTSTSPTERSAERNAERTRRGERSNRNPLIIALLLLVLTLGVALSPHLPGASGAGPCDAPANEIVAENCQPGSPASEWDVSGAGDASIQGFAADFSVDQGQTVNFKIKTDSTDYRLDIYRMGYYGGAGARKVVTVQPSATLPQSQPDCLTDSATGLIDCGNWAVSASWVVPVDAVSGIYFAKLVREETGATGASHIVFIVRDDNGNSDMLFQTADTTWQAYNSYGGNSLYVGAPAGRAYKVSYNRPFNTRGVAPEDWVFNSEYPMVRWLERNGYDVSYFTGVDSDRLGAEIRDHKIFLSVGHDEYWSSAQRANVKAARDAGVDLTFFSGNEVFWKTRWETSIDGSGTSHRTLVCYKETRAGAKIDPSAEWTGTWRDPRSFNPEGGQPENALTGTIFTVNCCSYAIRVPEADGKMRFWRNTSVATLAAGATATMPNETLGYEWDEDLDNGFRPAGLFGLSSTTENVSQRITDHGSNYAPGIATHRLTLYRDDNQGLIPDALVFGAGTVQWSWGLDSNHDRGSAPADTRMQQATVNLFADMGVQPGTLQTNLVAATASSDATAPTSTITSPTNGGTVQSGSPVSVTGTATDSGGGVVGGVEVSTDAGATWHPATGRTNWSYTWTPGAIGSATIMSRAVDDSGNLETPSAGTGITVQARACPCSIWSDSVTAPDSNDSGAVTVGVKFRSDIDGHITGLRFYKTSANTGTHVGHLWTTTGTLLAQATFTGETASGWQQVTLNSPVAITANTTYIASYHTTAGHYAASGSYFASSGVDNAPLRALANGEDGPNGVYQYGVSSSFPTLTFNSANYWVDVVFNTGVGPDTTPPTVTAQSPTNNASGTNTGANVTATFSEAMDAATINANTFELRDPSNNLVPATVTYNAPTRVATLDPTSSLANSTTYTATVKGGATDPRAKDTAGNALAANVTWSFTTAAPPPPPPNEGPGGPILVIASAANPFGRYYAEILRNEGLNYFTATDISTVSAATLATYNVVILGEMALTNAQVTMFSNWVNNGGNLIAMRPDKQLAGLLGLSDASATLSNAYMQVNTSTAPGAGIVGETIQFHGAADRYTLNGASSVATLYSNASTATVNPAVTLRSVGASGGQAAAFTYDLARSIVYTRQGNPAWSGLERDGITPIRSDDLFFGAASGDPQPDWIDLNKVAIPQADEQQRLLANLIHHINLDKKPLPRFWYFPKGKKAVVIMTGDDHGNGGTVGRFDQYKAQSPANCSVADWECIRGSSYIYTNTPLTDAQALAYHNDGFEVGLHVNTNCANWTPATLGTFYANQLSAWSAKYTSLPAPTTNRTHCIVWSDYATQPKVELAHGIRLDTNYYYYPPAWIQNRPGMFTGSGMPMRFADTDGTMIDIYQAVTQMTDESGQTYPFTIDTLLDRALGSEGYYGAFTANMHTDSASSSGSDAIINSATTRGVPVVSGRQMLEWLDGRNGSSFGALTWSGNTLSFTIAVGAGARNLQAMVPTTSAVGALTGITHNGASVAYTTQTIKGVEYAFFAASAGNYAATYAVDSTPPIISSLTAIPNSDGTATITWTTNEASDSRVNYGTASNALTLNVTDAALVTAHSVTLTGLAANTTYYYRVSSTDAANNTATSPPNGNSPASFTMPSASLTDTTVADFTAGTTGADTYIAETANGEVILNPTVGAEFSGSTLPAGWSSTAWNAGGNATVANGRLIVDGARAGTDALYGPGRSLEFVATFAAGTPNQHVGFGITYNETIWAMFSTKDGSGLYARTNNVNDTLISGVSLSDPHRFRIEWNINTVVFYIDGTQVASHSITITDNMRPLASDFIGGGSSLSIDWLRMSPHVASGTFTSRVFDAGGPANWGALSFTGQTPTGTGIVVRVRTGNTAIPDGSWSSFTPVSSGGAIGGNSRYIQYQAELTTSDAKQTPVLQEVSIGYSAGADTTPPTIVGRTPAPNASDIDVNSDVTVQFSEPMNGSTISNSTFRLRANGASSDVPAVVTYSGATAILNPTSPLQANKTYQVTVAGTVIDVSGNPLGSDSTWIFTTAAPPPLEFTDTTVADFSVGTPGANTYIAETANGEVMLNPTVGAEFSGSELPAGWTSTTWTTGGTSTVSGGKLTVDGARVNNTDALPLSQYGPGRALEFVATFGAATFQHAGFGVDVNTVALWAMFSTHNTSNALYARTNNNGTASNIQIPGNWLGIPHRYRIEWNTSDVVFYIDGNPVHTQTVSISSNMRPLVSDFTTGGPSVVVDWLRMTPYAASGTFLSRIIDAGSPANWGTLSWTGDTPAGTSLVLSVRTGNTPTPDGTWTAFNTLPNSGASIDGSSRYIQYRAEMVTGDPARTPTLRDVTIGYNPVPPNSAPDAMNDTATVVEDSGANSINVLANDTDADNNTLTITSKTDGAKGTVTITGGGSSLTYTPNANATDSDSFTYTISDGNGGSDTATVTVTITEANDAPVANAQLVETNEDTAKSITLSASDVDGDTLTYSIVTQPAHGILSGTGANQIYTPEANYSGADSFTYKVNDGTVDSNVATVTITVSSVNDAPLVTNPGNQTTPEGAAVSLQIQASDPEESTLSYSAGGLPPGLSINSGTGLITGTLPYTAAGTYEVTVTVSDGLTSSNVNFTWVVTNVDIEPPAAPQGLVAGVSSIGIDLDWINNSEADVARYNVYRSDSETGSYTKINAASITSSAHTDTTAPRNATSYYRVTAVDTSNNESAHSATASATRKIAFRAATSAENRVSTTLTIGTPQGLVAGDMMLASIDVRSNPNITVPAGWTQLLDHTIGTAMRQTTYYKLFSGASEPVSHTWSFSSSEAATGGIVAYSGVDNTNPIDVAGGQTNSSSSSITAPSVTTTVADTLLVGFYGMASNPSIQPPAGMIEQIERIGTGQVKITTEIADAIHPSAGATGERTAMTDKTAANIGHLVALRPMSLAPPPTPIVGLQYYPLPTPVRLLDTRPGESACHTPGTPLTGGGTRTEPARIPCTGIPANAQVIVGNATVVNTGGGATGGFITLYPSGAALPTASNLNYVAGQIVPNAFTVGLGSGDGAFNIFASSSTHFIADLTGYFAP